MPNWNPDPIDVTGIRNLWYKPLNVMSLLLGIYTNNTMFALEYKNLLSQRLVKNMNFDVNEDLRNLESLKLKLGKDYFKDCDVTFIELIGWIGILIRT